MACPWDESNKTSARPDPVSISCALESQLRSLCLREYPFGKGSWQISSKEPMHYRKYATTTNDYGAERDHLEALEELMRSPKSPWHKQTDWSEEIPHLQQLAISEPAKLTNKYIYQAFRTLKIIDKNVTELDEELLKLGNLEELSLSANYLTEINSSCLPPKLKVLELYANSIKSLASLCRGPPPLHHLGLGKNLIDDCHYISEHYWPHLMSLDLSENNLCDLLGLVDKLVTLPKLRSLHLTGNPVSVIPSYRGYVIDSLSALTAFDDVIITADERHGFRGLARKAELLRNQARMLLKVTSVKGVPNPNDNEEADKVSEYPVIERKYFVQFPFISNVHKKLLKSAEILAEIAEKEANAKKNKAPQGKAKSPTPKSEEELEQARAEEEKRRREEEERLGAEPQLVNFSTCQLDQDPEMMFEHEEKYRVGALLMLRDLLKTGIKFSVVEEKNTFYPPGQNPEELAALAAERAHSGRKSSGRRGSILPKQEKAGSRRGSNSEQKGSRRGSIIDMKPWRRGSITDPKNGRRSSITGRRDSLQNSTPESKVGGPKGAAGSKKTAASSSATDSLVRYSSERRVVGSAVLDTSPLLEGDSVVRAALHAGGGPMRPEDYDIEGALGGGDSGGKKDKKDKKQDKKAKPGKDKKKAPGAEEEEVEIPPIVIMAEVSIRRWSKTKQFIKEHDEPF